MRIRELDANAVEARLAGEGLAVDLGAARVRVRSSIPGLPEAFRTVYGAFPVEAVDGFFDLSVHMVRTRNLRRGFRPQADFFVDGGLPFAPFPADTHLPLLEWGINSCFAQQTYHHLLLHAGVVEKSGCAAVLPALPGSGKSTLTAALVRRGYRLLSDEFAVVRLSDRMLLPMLKPLALKNQSIDVIRTFDPSAVIGPSFPNTRKGTVAHLAPDESSVSARRVPARPALVIFPQYTPGADLLVHPVQKSRAFARLAVNSFNYELLGPDGFDAVGDLIEACECYRLEYSRLDEAIETMNELIEIVSEPLPALSEAPAAH